MNKKQLTRKIAKIIGNWKDVHDDKVFFERDYVKKQANNWDLKKLKNKIYEINEIETLIKTNSKNSLNILSDFIISY